ncbi:MAG: GTP-binding protein [Eubacterium sp.]|nr:GTP-binding protein [Eubacterium sp.]
MAKVDIFSGFLGAGKTTLIKKLIAEAYGDEKIVLIENEFGEIGVDSGFLKETGVQINEMNAGCICCTLVGDFGRALNEVIEKFDPDRILIEPSGVGKLSDVIIAVQDLHNDKIQLNGFTTVVDAKKAKMYLKNFGEFYKNQVENASSIILSHTKGLDDARIDEVVKMMREMNPTASIVTTDWDQISGAQILETMEKQKTLSAELDKLREEAYAEQAEHEAEHHHHHHDDDEEEHEHHCCHHHDDDEEEEHEHHCCHHHDDDDEEEGHEHHCHHHHDDDEEEEHEHHHHHHHHHADEVFDQFGVETARRYTMEEMESILEGLEDEEACGMVLRSKGIVEGEDGQWIHFDYVPGEPEVRTGTAEATGMICVIGTGLKKDHIKELFGIK